MLKFLKPKASTQLYGPSLTVNSASGAPLYTLPPEKVSTLRHMITGLTCNQELPARLTITSAMRGEGVTHTALAVGSILASDQAPRVCVVELNWWEPGLLQHLHREALQSEPQTDSQPVPGIADVLSGKTSLDEALIQTSLPNLALLPAGELAVEQRPIVARSAALKELIAELGQRFDHLVLDVPAILATSDAIALTSLGNACCLVVRQGVTPTVQVKAALDDVRHLKMLGVVLNQVSFQTPGWIRSLVPQD